MQPALVAPFAFTVDRLDFITGGNMRLFIKLSFSEKKELPINRPNPALPRLGKIINKKGKKQKR